MHRHEIVVGDLRGAAAAAATATSSATRVLLVLFTHGTVLLLTKITFYNR